MLRRLWRRSVSVRSRVTPLHPVSATRSQLTLETLEERDVPSLVLVSAADPFFHSSSASADGQSETSPRYSVSDDGRYIVFVSTADNLLAGQTKSSAGTTENVYLYDNVLKSITLITHAAGEPITNADAASFNPVISGNGSTVAFFSTATDLISGDTITSGTVQLYLYDVVSGNLTLVTHDPADATKGGDATNPFIPATPSNSYGAVNTLGYNAGINLGLGQVVGGGLALPSLSSDGNSVAFISNASDLGYTLPIASSTNAPITEVFLYDRGQNSLTLVSHKDGDNSTGALTSKGDGYASTVAISRDGTTVAFTAPFDNLPPSANGTTNLGYNDQLYVWSRINDNNTGLTAGQMVLASHEYGNVNAGASIDSFSFLFGFTADNPPTLSDNGAYIAYYDAGGDLVNTQGGTASILNVFRYDVKNNTNLLATHTADSNTTAGDNPPNAIAPFGVGPAEATGPEISSDGRYIAYANNSSNLISPSFGSSYNGADQVYLYDATTQTNTLVSHDDGSTTAPSPTGGTAPSMSASGQLVSYLDWAYPASGTPTSAIGSVRLYDSQAIDPKAIPPALGTAFDPGLDPIINGGILAPSVMDRSGVVVAWDGSSSTNVANDNNSNLDVFLTINAPPAPSQLTLTPLDVPQLNNYTFGQFTTTGPAGEAYQYTLVPGPGSTDNNQFVIVNDMLQTDSTFITQPQTTYSILVQTTDKQYPLDTLQQQFTLTLVQGPTGLSLSQYLVPNSANTTFAQFVTTGQSGRPYQYTLVPGQGSTDNSQFTISNGQLVTGGNFPLNQGTFNIRVRVSDPEFPDLYFEQPFTLTVVNPPSSIQTATSGVPATPNTTFTQFTTTGPGGETYQYTLVPGTGDTDNSQFTISNGQLQTGSGFPPSGQDTFSILVQTTDSAFPSLYTQQPFTFTLVNAPTSFTLSNATIAAGANSPVGTFTVPGSAQQYTYSLVSGTGGTDNGNFTISGSTLQTGSSFPSTAPATYSVRIRVTDNEFPSLSYDQVFTINVVNAPAPPNLTVAPN